MKKGIIFGIIIIVLALALAGTAVWLHFSNQEKIRTMTVEAANELLDRQTLTVDGVTIEPRDRVINSGEQEISALSQQMDPEVIEVTEIHDLGVRLPENGKNVKITINDGSGKRDISLEELSECSLRNGLYIVEISCDLDENVQLDEKNSAVLSGYLDYVLNINVNIPMTFSLSQDTVKQGSAVTVTGHGVFTDVSGHVNGMGDDIHIVVDESGNASGMIGISYRCSPGTYDFVITAGEETFTFPITVEKEDYEVQHLIIDETVRSETVTNQDASIQYSNMLEEAYASWIPQRYYDDCFTQPIDGTVTTQFGLYRYTNDYPTPSRHAGVDIANAEGTPIKAAANGKAIVARWLTTTGYTIVIDHGYGVKTFYYHMSEIMIEEGSFVYEGDYIGKVGMTGYATGPHLHFNLMVGENSIDPWPAFDGSSGIFTLPAKQTVPGEN